MWRSCSACVAPRGGAASVRGPAHSVKRGKTPVLDPSEARALLDAIDATTPAGLRDRALIGLMVYSFARIGAALAMRVEGAYVQNRRPVGPTAREGWQASATRCPATTTSRPTCTTMSTAAGSPAIRRARCSGRSAAARTRRVDRDPLPQANAYAMIRRRAAAAGIETKIGNHTFRATGITAYLKNGGTLERAATMANHASTRTTQLYDRRRDEVTLDEVERVAI